MSSAAPIDRAFEEGSRLAFIIGAFRGGTTLLRKMLDSHPRLYSPAETWFLLPLVNLWEGLGEAPHFVPRQAGAAIKQHLGMPQFLECCRAFAARFYAANLPQHAAWFIDKTPLYLHLAPVLPAIFPRARFLALARDPRGICWSRHTWKHMNSPSPEAQFPGVAADVRKLAAFIARNPQRTRLVSYERLCAQPREELESICAFLNVEFDPAMIAYGDHPHHEGYGDENTRQHQRPHLASVARWNGGDGLAADQQAALLEMCGAEALAALGCSATAGALAAAESCTA